MSSRKRIERSDQSDAEHVSDVRAIFVSDLHLQARPPVARSAEPNWFDAMARPLNEIANLAEEHGAVVLYAGDIFDRWNAGPEVINFALRHLPQGFAIPGQHDLPNHSYDDIKKSAYWTLVAAGHIENIYPGDHITVNDGLCLRGFPWGFEPEPSSPHGYDGSLYVALVHKYIWTAETGYAGASSSDTVAAYRGRLAGYDAVAFGDNHKGFITQRKGGPVICNCGGMMRRKTDERDYKPGVGLLLGDGRVVRHHFDTTQDVFITLTDSMEVVDKVLDMNGFLRGLEELGAGDALDFESALRGFIRDNNIDEIVRDILLAACNDTK